MEETATRKDGRRFKRVAVVAIVATLATLLIASAALALGIGRNSKRFSVEVAEDHTRFVWNGDHELDASYADLEGFPAYGDFFVTQGYIYPDGTLNGATGTNPDGSARFPDEVIGEWTCYGTHVGDGAATSTGPWVVTTQIFNFGDGYGNHTIVTDGYEISDFGEEVTRAVTGGTGTWRRARGEQTQVTVGFNDHFGLQFESSFRIRR